MELQFYEIARRNPVVVCATNYVTAELCADALLAAGASPVMSTARKESVDLADICSSLLVNIGTPDSPRAMLKSAEAFHKKGKPAVLDPCGAGATSLRTQLAMELLHTDAFDIIKGNFSEIMTMSGRLAHSRGVDSGEAADIETKTKIARELAISARAVVVITGATDVVSDGVRTALIGNGTPFMSRISGTGCVCGALCAAMLGAGAPEFEAAVTATCVTGIAGEIATAKCLPSAFGSFKPGFVDAIGCIDESIIERMAKIEIR